MIACVAEIKPREVFEGIMTLPMAATHVVKIRACHWRADAERIDRVQAHCFENTELARTCAMPWETLGTHRSGGKHAVRIWRATVEAGILAVQGDVSIRGEG